MFIRILIFSLFFFHASNAFSEIEKKGKISSSLYKLEMKGKVNEPRKADIYVFCLEGYKFFMKNNFGGGADQPVQFFINENGQSVPGKCE